MRRRGHDFELLDAPRASQRAAIEREYLGIMTADDQQRRRAHLFELPRRRGDPKRIHAVILTTTAPLRLSLRKPGRPGGSRGNFVYQTARWVRQRVG